MLKKLLPLCLAVPIFAAAQPQNGPSLLDLSLDELVQLEVTSASRRAEPLAETSSAVYVITRDDIARYGIRNIPEALKLVPGLNVFQIDGSRWAISSRGFVGRFANKLLVLMDGRTLYTPSFSGVYWDAQDTLMEEIERIEVIRGPGSTTWGSNAVNGVINIITRPVDSTEAASFSFAVEDDGSNRSAMRYSFESGTALSHRVFLKHHDIEGNERNGGPAFDTWQQARLGYRLDWAPGNSDEFSLIAEVYDGDSGMTQTLLTPQPPYSSERDIVAKVSGAFVIGRWKHEHDAGSASSLQLVLDDADRLSPQIGEKKKTWSVDFQHQLSLPRHEIVFGTEFRVDDFVFSESETIAIDTTNTRIQNASIFVQDQFELISDRLSLILGTKLEHNDLSNSNYDVMPSVRLLWQPQSGPTVWAAATRSVRTPSHADLNSYVRDIRPIVPPGDPSNPFPVPMRTAIVGSGQFRSEELQAIEAGLRGQLSSRVAYDLALFHMEYDDLRAFAPTDAVCDPGNVSVTTNPLCVLTADTVISELQLNNQATGNVHGAEFAVDIDALDNLRLRTAYVYTDESIEPIAPSDYETRASVPEHTVSVRTEWSLSPSFNVAAVVRFVDDIPAWEIDDYWQGSIQLNWRVNDSWRLSMGGRNLLSDGQIEAKSELNDIAPVQIETSYYLRGEWDF